MSPLVFLLLLLGAGVLAGGLLWIALCGAVARWQGSGPGGEGD